MKFKDCGNNCWKLDNPYLGFDLWIAPISMNPNGSMWRVRSSWFIDGSVMIEAPYNNPKEAQRLAKNIILEKLKDIEDTLSEEDDEHQFIVLQYSDDGEVISRDHLIINTTMQKALEIQNKGDVIYKIEDI